MAETPEQTARNTLAELGQTPGGDPIAQLATYADEASNLLQEIRGRMHLTHQPPTDLDEYNRVRDNTMTARFALVRIHAARETAQLEAILELPDTPRDQDKDAE